jgi:hypothetical protein
MKNLFVLTLAMFALIIAASSGRARAAETTPAPMAGHLIVYGDTVWFDGSKNPQNCTEKSRFEPGQGVGFRMTAIDPMTGHYLESAELTVHLKYGGQTEDLSMRYRGSGKHPHPGMWSAKWVVPKGAPTGVVTYTVTAKDDKGRTGEYKPFDVEASKLTIVSGQ